MPPPIETLSPSAAVQMADKWYEIASADHFWIQWRFANIVRLLEGIELGPEVLEVGCGNAIARQQFEKHYNRPIDGCDLNLAALNLAEEGRGKLYLYNIHDRRPEWKDRFHTIVLLDVLEHIEDPAEFLRSLAWHLHPAGHLVINVPALQWLFSRYDAEMGHQRRYTTAMMRSELQQASFELVRSRYWGLTTIPVLMLRKLMVQFTGKQKMVETGFKPSPVTDRILRMLMHGELACLRRPWIGTSLLGLARKADVERPADGARPANAASSSQT